MKKLLVLIIVVFTPTAWGCGAVTVLNTTGFDIEIGYDLGKLRQLEIGASSQLEKMHSQALPIKSIQQNCMYDVSEKVVVKKLKNQQFVVIKDGNILEPVTCQ